VRSRRRPQVRSATIVIACAVSLAACGGSSSPSSSSSPGSSATTGTTAPSTSVATRTISGLGPVLVDAQGRTLYMFEPDKHSKVTCTGSCAELWPPAKLTGSGKPSASGQVQASLLGSDPDPEGGSVITYGGWPLYTYVSDTEPGQANGQGLETDGGLWYVISPAGKVITKSR